MKGIYKSMVLFSAWILCSGFHSSDDIRHQEPVVPAPVSLVFAGDIMGHSPQFSAAYNPATKTYHYEACFEQVKNYISRADFAIANLEVTLAGPPYEGYPRFSSPDALADGLKYAGYDVLLTANNHVADRGRKGLERTLDILRNRKFLFAGSYYNQAQRDSLYPLMLEKSGLRIALLNSTYSTNGIAVTAPNIVNRIDTTQIRKDIQQAKERNADIIIMAIHWGAEYALQASENQRNLARWMAQNGIGLIIGSHPHVVQNAEIILTDDGREVPVYYSVGNSISNQRKPHTDGGIMVQVTLNPGTGQIISHSYLPVFVHKGKLHGQYQFHLIATPDYLARPDSFALPAVDSLALRWFDEQTRERLGNMRLWEERN
jgi:poly-gamma-glutamate synthesis protein (capsule biosynthesis protein)